MASDDSSHPQSPEDLPPDNEPDHEPKGDDLLGRLRARPSLARDRYRFVEEAGRGGMGAVLRVRDLDLRRNLAMKVILGQATGAASTGDTPSVDPVDLQRFLHEARITGQLEHPGVVPVHELGIDEQQRVYFTMRLVRGATADQVFALAHADEQGWTLTRALEVVLKVCDTMAFAHGKKVLHRDLKPSNVMVGRYGEVYVMDWGLAKVVDEPECRDLRLREQDSFSRVRLDDGNEDGGADSPLVTVDGAVVGTPCYMSPEQADGKLEELDARTDVYSVGAMLYQLLTGCPPYVNPGARVSPRALLAAVRHGPPPRPGTIDPTIPAELVAICEKAMTREKRDRYASMTELGDDLRAFLDRRVVRAYRTGARAELIMWFRRNRALAAAIVVAALLLVAGSVASTAFALQSAEHVRELDYQSYVANIQMADKYLGLAEFGRVRERLAACPESLRGWEWRHLLAECDQSLLDFPGETSPQLAPDGTFLAMIASDGAVHIRDVMTGALRNRLVGPGDRVSYLRLSADGRVLVAAAGQRVRSWDATTWRLLADGEVGGISFDCPLSHHGALLVASSKSHQIGLWNTATWECTRELPIDSYSRSVFSMDDAMLVVLTQDGTSFWDTASGTQIRSGKGSGVYDPLVFSPDGTCLFDRGITSRLVDIATWKATELTGPSIPSCVAFSRDGSKIVTCDLDCQVRVWDTATRQCLATLEGHEDFVGCVAISPDGSRIATASEDHSPRIQDWRNGGAFHLTGHDARVDSVAWTADGRRLVTGSTEGTRVWDSTRPPTAQRVLCSSHDGTLALSLVDQRQASEAPVASAPHIPEYPGSVVDVATGAMLCRISAPIADAIFSPGDSEIATLDAKGRVCAWDARTGIPKALAIGPGVCHADFDSTGARLASGHEDGSVSIWDVASGACIASRTGHTGYVSRVSFDATGQRIVSCSKDGTARIWDTSNLTDLGVLVGHTQSVHSVHWSHDGKMVATTSRDETARIWNAATCAELFRVPCTADAPGCVAFRSDDLQVAVPCNSQCEVWSVPARQREFVLSGHKDVVTFVGFSPDGARIVTSSQDETARVWDARNGSDLVELKTVGNSGNLAFFTLDGSRVVTIQPNGELRIFGDVPFRVRFPALESARAALHSMQARVVPRLEAGESPQAVRAAVATDPSLSRDEKVGAQAAVSRWLDDHK